MSGRGRWIVLAVSVGLIGCSLARDLPRLSSVEGDQDVVASFPAGWDRHQVYDALGGLSDEVACVQVINRDPVHATPVSGPSNQLGVQRKPEHPWIVKVVFDAELSYEERIPLAADVARALEEAGATGVVRFGQAALDASWAAPRCTT